MPATSTRPRRKRSPRGSRPGHERALPAPAVRLALRHRSGPATAREHDRRRARRSRPALHRSALRAAAAVVRRLGRSEPTRHAPPLGRLVTAEPVAIREPELVNVADLKAHPRNYRTHPDAQIQHLIASFRAFGVLPTIVVARDGTILGGHGVWITAQRLGVTRLLATRLDLDPASAEALKLVDVREGDLLGLLGTGLSPDDLTNMIARADPRLPEGFRHLTPGEPDADGLDEPPTVAQMIMCPVCGHSFIPGDVR